MEKLLFFTLAFVSEIVGTMAGFGSSTIFLPLALFFVDFRSAIVLVAFFHLFGNIARVGFFKHDLNKEILRTFGIPSVLLSIIGAMTVGILPQTLLKFALGIFLILFSLFSLFRPGFSFPTNKKSVALGGGISGFLSGLIGTGGALRAAFLTGFHLHKFTYIVTSGSIAIATDLIRIPIYISQGFLTEEIYLHIPVLFAMAIFGSYVGKTIVKRVKQQTFRKLVLLAVILVSIKLVIDGLSF